MQVLERLSLFVFLQFVFLHVFVFLFFFIPLFCFVFLFGTIIVCVLVLYFHAYLSPLDVTGRQLCRCVRDCTWHQSSFHLITCIAQEEEVQVDYMRSSVCLSIYYKSSRVLIMIFAFHPNDYQHNYSSPRVPTSVDRRILTGLGREGENDSNPPVRLPPCPSEPQLILVNTCLIHAIWKRS